MFTINAAARLLLAAAIINVKTFKQNMKKIIHITAHSDESIVLIYKGEWDDYKNISFLTWLKKNFPLIDWAFDDGDDVINSNYVQYVCYPEGKKNGNYILAGLYLVDDDSIVL